MSLLGKIKPLVQGEVLNDEQILETYSKDASIFRIKPENEYTFSPPLKKIGQKNYPK